MSTTPQRNPILMTEAEYLAFDDASQYKHEYVDGEIIAFLGNTNKHNRIMIYTANALINGIGDRKCVVLPSDMRVRVASMRYRFPDITVTCGETQFTDEKEDILLNPTLIVEVLSTSTRSVDMIEKLMEYQQMPSVQDYLLIEQDQPLVMRYQRQSVDEWLHTLTQGLDTALTLNSIGITLKLADIYKQVSFDDKED